MQGFSEKERAAMPRRVEIDDMDSAARGLRLAHQRETALRDLITRHGAIEVFASRVIAAAAMREMERRAAMAVAVA